MVMTLSPGNIRTRPQLACFLYEELAEIGLAGEHERVRPNDPPSTLLAQSQIHRLRTLN